MWTLLEIIVRSKRKIKRPDLLFLPVLYWFLYISCSPASPIASIFCGVGEPGVRCQPWHHTSSQEIGWSQCVLPQVGEKGCWQSQPAAPPLPSFPSFSWDYLQLLPAHQWTHSAGWWASSPPRTQARDCVASPPPPPGQVALICITSSYLPTIRQARSHQDERGSGVGVGGGGAAPFQGQVPPWSASPWLQAWVLLYTAVYYIVVVYHNIENSNKQTGILLDCRKPPETKTWDLSLMC